MCLAVVQNEFDRVAHGLRAKQIDRIRRGKLSRRDRNNPEMLAGESAWQDLLEERVKFAQNQKSH